MNQRIEELDSLRGLASVNVFLHHMYLVTAIPIFPIMFGLLSPFRIFINGHSAVIIFFILSGFVLFLPYSKGQKVPYRIFFTKRVFRIYVPYLVSILIAIILAALISQGGIKELSYWFNLSWTTEINLKLFLEHLFLIGNIHSNPFNNVIWSLVHELRISLIFPLIAYIVLRCNWKITILICFFLSFIGGINNYYHFQISNGNYTTIFDTFHYTSMFILGALLAKGRGLLFKTVKGSSTLIKIILLIVAFVLYTFPDFLANKIQLYIPSLVYFNVIVNEYFVAVSGSIIILISMSSLRISKLLLTKPIIFLGKISYSLYLYHLIVLLSMLNLFYGKITLSSIFILSVIIGLGVSTFMYYSVELPSIRFCRRLITKQTEKQELKVSA